MTTACTNPIVTAPIKFLGATVLSFNTNLGLGSQESSLSVDLVEDCEANPPDNFWPKPQIQLAKVGDAVIFPFSAPPELSYTFGGILSNWTISQNSSGRVYNAKVVDPRQLLQNVGVVVDSTLLPPVGGDSPPNYINVYSHFERKVFTKADCSVYGSSLSNERGMPYLQVVKALIEINPTIYSPTGQPLKVNWSDFPNAPAYYRVSGPQTALQILQDVCDANGLEFYVYLEGSGQPGDGNFTIRVGTINLKIDPENINSFSNIVSSFDGVATDMSYGQELRNEKTKAMIFGEQVHYLSYVDCFNHYFGEEQDPNTGELVPIVPINFNANGQNFVIKKLVTELNLGLYTPLGPPGQPDNGPFRISEVQIRAAMASREAWDMIVFDPALENDPNDLAKKIRDRFAGGDAKLKDAIQNIFGVNSNVHPQNRFKELMRIRFNPSSAAAKKGKNKEDDDINKIHQFVANLGNTFYGKQFIAKLNEKICYFVDRELNDIGNVLIDNPNFGEKIFSSTPTNAGGWYEFGAPVLGLSDPDLGAFRTDDQRVISFGVFNIDGEAEEPEDDGIPEEPKEPEDSPGNEGTSENPENPE